jgi:hypothetical protein
LIAPTRLQREILKNANLLYSRAIEQNAQRSLSAIGVIHVNGGVHALYSLRPPIQAGINIRLLEAGIHNRAGIAEGRELLIHRF